MAEEIIDEFGDQLTSVTLIAGEGGRFEVDVDGTTALARKEDLDELRDTKPNRLVRLLPGFDQYVIAVNRNLIPAEHLSKVSRTSGWISPVILHCGRIAGVWTLEDGKLGVDAFEDIPKKLLDAELERISATSRA